MELIKQHTPFDELLLSKNHPAFGGWQTTQMVRDAARPAGLLLSKKGISYLATFGCQKTQMRQMLRAGACGMQAA